MDKLIIDGPSKLSGVVRISSAKNSCLPLMTATLLLDGKTEFHHLPKLQDIDSLSNLLRELGSTISTKENLTTIDGSSVDKTFAPYDLVRKMRASILVLGPLLARFGEAEVSLPGGCAIGTRPIDIHLEGMKSLGAEIIIEQGYVKAKAKKLIGTTIDLPFPSVGATENLMMAAVYAEGTTVIKNAAKEPEIVDLANYLKVIGVEIDGAGSSNIKITGKSEVIKGDFSYTPISDRIEAMTYIVAALITNSEVTIENCEPTHFEEVLKLLKNIGGCFEIKDKTIFMKTYKKLKPFNFETAPYPGIPTDVQAQLVALALTIDGESLITESVFENRFMHVPEMIRMGGQISLGGNTATINKSELKGAPVMCTDLRASAALVLCALVSEGETEISRIYHLDRGYEKLEDKFASLGCSIKRTN